MPAETTSKIRVFKLAGVWHYAVWTNGTFRTDGALRIAGDATDDQAIEAAREMWENSPGLGEFSVEHSTPPDPDREHVDDSLERSRKPG
jgi:hypothetical protein